MLESQRRDVVVMGASLGGMEALKNLFADLPPEFPAALFVVWHMPAESLNLLPDILQRTTELPVTSAEDGQKVEAGCAYIARPDYHLAVEQNARDGEYYVRLTRGPKENRFRPAIDVLFRSAALAFGPRVIGVVLTGALDDGASGLYAVKKRGGLAVVQDPLDAECPNMPINAMRAVQVDHSAPIAGMGALLQRLVNLPTTEGGQPVMEPSADIRLQTEVRVALEDSDLEKGIIALGELSPYTCPECHGVLVQISEGNITRFRCHTGHAFTLDALLAEATRVSGEALWTAVRALQETEMLTGHLAKHLREAGQEEAADACLKEMVRARRQANLVRQATMQSEVLSEEKLEQETPEQGTAS